MKKAYIVLCIALLAFSTSPMKAEDNLGISFEGDSKKFVIFEGNENSSAFQDMMPGETSTQVIKLKNDDFTNMRFYVKVDQDQMLDNSNSSKRIVYDLEFKNNGEVFYTARIGTKQNSGKENLNENYLLSTLAKGSTTTLEMSIKVDGTSMDDSYQGNIGNLGLVFSVESDSGNPVTEIVKKIPVLNKIPGVNTGDTTALNMLLVLLGVSAIAIIVVIAKRKKGDDDERA